MIQMPRRSVTRFFIPLIDVLILLFCIFLLMEFETGTKVDQQSEVVDGQAESIDELQAELRRRTNELHKFEELRPQLAELEQLRAEVERLQKANHRDFHDEWDIRILKVDPNGSLSYVDAKQMNAPVLNFRDEMSARKLIQQHKDEARGRKVFYYFQFPEGKVTVALSPQERRTYRNWFRGDGVDNSLPPEEKKKGKK